MKYQIQGETLPVVICELEAGERMITEGGAMSWMSPNMKMETTSNGGIGKAFGRAFSGEKMFQNIYTAQGGPGMIAFASSFPGSIRAFEVSSGQDMIFQKSAFLASEAGVQLSMHFRKKLGAGFFGGEGFILQDMSGTGMVFLEIDGNKVEKQLAPGEVIKVDTGNVVAFEKSVKYEVETVKGLKNIFFGGEGLFLTRLTGPGRVVLQTQNFNEFAGRIARMIPGK